MNIEELLADQKTDALVAEQVMGWVVDEGRWCFPDSSQIHQRALFEPGLANSFCPSRSMLSAWEVVDLLMRRGFGFQLITGYPPGWIAWFGFASTLELQEIDAHGVGETAPLAICRAALKTAMKRK